MIQIDGSKGEGGGQILRSSLALSLCTGQPFCMKNIRAGRKKPGLMRQHLTAVNAATEVSNATVSGAEIGSQELTFLPGTVRGGTYHFAVGTAGSSTLVLQTILMPLLLAAEPSTVRCEGGTHNPFAPPYDFIEQCFFPVLRGMGVGISAQLERHGFYPAGGGCFDVAVHPAEKLQPFELLKRGELKRRWAVAVTSCLPRSIAEAELNTARELLNWGPELFELRDVKGCGPGNIFFVGTEFEHVTEVATGFGERGVPAERVAKNTARALQHYLVSPAVVGEHLADQLLLPMALAGGGVMKVGRLSSHTRTNIAVIEQFMSGRFSIDEAESVIRWG